MGVLIYLIAILAFFGIIITVLAFIGLKAKRQEQKWIDEYNKEALATFRKVQDAKKKKRQSTPKVPTIE